MSIIYNGLQKLFGGGKGNVALATKATTADNSTLFNNKAYANILERTNTYLIRVNSPGWYRVAASINRNNVYGCAGIAFIGKSFNNASASEQYIYAIAGNSDNKFSITQLAGIYNTSDVAQHDITKVRLVSQSSIVYLDIYYRYSHANDVSITTVGGFKAQTPTLISDTPTNYVEFDTAIGFKS